MHIKVTGLVIKGLKTIGNHVKLDIQILIPFLGTRSKQRNHHTWVLFYNMKDKEKGLYMMFLTVMIN